MNPEELPRLEACLLEAAEILYRNTPTEELTSFESIEKTVRTKMLEQVSPKIAFFLSTYTYALTGFILCVGSAMPPQKGC
jgi:hypothetical protein